MTNCTGHGRHRPSFCRTNDLNDCTIQLVMHEGKHIPLSQGLIFNKFYHINALILVQIRTICPNICALALSINSTPTSSNTIWQEDKRCISWRDRQPSKSVVYVSIGDVAVMTKHQMCEIWHGLVNSGVRFLWVRRPGSVTGYSDETGILSPQVDSRNGG